MNDAPSHDWKQTAWEYDDDFFVCRRCHLEVNSRRGLPPASEEDCRREGIPVCRTIEELIDRSSLGTPEAKAIRGRTPPEVTERVLRRSDEIAASSVQTLGFREGLLRRAASGCPLCGSACAVHHDAVWCSRCPWSSAETEEYDGKAGGDPDAPMCPMCRVEMKRADENRAAYERVKFKLAEVAADLDALRRDLDQHREPCPNHKYVRLLPWEGCAVCANST